MTTHVRATLPVAPAPRSTLDDFLLVMLPTILVAMLLAFGHDEERSGVERMMVTWSASIWNDVSILSVLAIAAEIVLILIGLVVTVGAELELKVSIDEARAKKEAKRARAQRPCNPKPETTSEAKKPAPKGAKTATKYARVPATRPAEPPKKTPTPKVEEKARATPEMPPVTTETVKPPVAEPKRIPVEVEATDEMPAAVVEAVTIEAPREEEPEVEIHPKVVAEAEAEVVTERPERVAEKKTKKDAQRPAAATAARGLRRTVVLHKPSAASALGIVLVGDAPRPPHVVSLRADRIAAQTSGIKVGDRVLSVNGRAARGHAQTTRMLKERVGRVAIVVEAGEVTTGGGADGGAVLRATRAFATGALMAQAASVQQQQQQQAATAEAATVVDDEEEEAAEGEICSSRLSMWLRCDDDASCAKGGGGKASDEKEHSDTDCDGSSGWESSDACDSSAEAEEGAPEDALNDETFGAATEQWAEWPPHAEEAAEAAVTAAAAAVTAVTAAAARDIDWAQMSRLVDMLSVEGDAKRAAFAEGRKLLGGAWY